MGGSEIMRGSVFEGGPSKVWRRVYGETDVIVAFDDGVVELASCQLANVSRRLIVILTIGVLDDNIGLGPVSSFRP